MQFSGVGIARSMLAQHCPGSLTRLFTTFAVASRLMLYEGFVRDLVCRGWTAVLQLVPRPLFAWHRDARSCLYQEAGCRCVGG